ncbi:P-loop NTPase [Elioraea sp.]|uniref:AAA family ATPase n=1 Tax=Elioraea sp. TaxID=2185103 RepID=UPI00307D4228
MRVSQHVMQGESTVTPSGDPAAPLTGGIRRLPLLAFLADARSEQVLREVLLEAGPDGAEVRRGDITAATELLARAATPQVLLVDISGLDEPFAALDALAQVCEPDVRVLVVGERDEVDFYRDLTRNLGVTEYLPKPLTRDLVSRTFLPLIANRPPAHLGQRGGRVVMVTGVRGGVGASTIAANLAVHLADEARRHVALVDLDLHTGTAALLVGARASAGLRTAIEAPEMVDALFLDRAGQPVSDRLRVFAAEEALTSPVVAAPEAIGHLIRLLRDRFNHVVIDAPAGLPPLVREALDRVHQRVLVMAPDVANARDLVRYHALPNAPAQTSSAVVVLNQAGRPGGLAQKQVEETLRLAPDVVVPYLPRLLPSAGNLGKPAVMRAGPFRSAIRLLAQEIAAVRPAEEAGRRSRRLFGLFRR